MRDDICTIPITDIFEVKDGCPLCRMHETVEEHIVSYILGDAMMEPDVRIETNRLGFCDDHFQKMYDHNGRLQLAVMLETHIKSIAKETLEIKNSAEKNYKSAKETNSTCFICDKINWGEKRMIDTIYRCYESEEDFREMFNSQPFYCFKHYEMLMGGINKHTLRKHGKEMSENLTRITRAYADNLSEKITKYCSMYDYHHAGNTDFGDSRYAVEEIIKFLTMNQKGS